MKNTTRSFAAGFSLLEVLIAVVIMSVGLLALAALQVSILRSSTEAKAQTVALNVARDKLEELASYKIVNEPTGGSCPSANDSYQCIDSAAATENVNDDGTGNLGSMNLQRTWTVERYTGNAATGAFTAAGSNTAAWTSSIPRNEFKRITVTVTWTDANGQAQSLAVKDAVGAVNPSDVALVQKLFAGIKPRPAVGRIWDPGTVSGVIPIAVGNGTSSAATNPKPEVISGNSVVETRFDVLTYSGLNGGAAEAQARVETSIVGCTCQFASLPSTARGLRPSYWNGTNYTVPVPTSGAPVAQAANVTQSAKCDVCCRDHNDTGITTTAKFSPYITTHAHYNSNAVGAQPVTSGQYKEACRLIRVNGVFRVAPDMNNEYFALLATEDLSNSSHYGETSFPDDQATTVYQGFVIDYMNDRFTTKANLPTVATATNRADYNAYHTTTPCISGTSQVAGPCALEATILGTATARSPSLNAPSQIDVGNNDVKWNHSRGLFVDYLEPEAIQVITNAKTNCPSQSGSGFSDCVLKYLPFTSINLTEIADWDSSATAQVVVTNFDYSQSISNVDPVRGKVIWGTTPTSNSTPNVNTKSRKTNSGLLDLSFDSISPADSAMYTDTQNYRVTGTNSNAGSNGSFTATLVGTSGSTPAVTYVTGVQNSLPCNAGNGQNFLINTCNVTNANSGGGLGVANSMKVVALNYNAQVDGSNNGGTTTAGQVTCYDGAGQNPVAVPAGEKYTAHTCMNYAVTSATLVSAANVAGPSGTVVSSGIDGALSEKTVISFPMINTGDKITINFGTPTQSSPALLCSYAAKQNGNTYTVEQANCTP